MAGDPIAVMWGKSNASGRAHLLIAHLLDAAAVAELLWDEYLAPGVRAKLDDCWEGRGRSLLSLVCGLHDVGKASPAFQSKDKRLWTDVVAAGFDSPGMSVGAAKAWHHTLAGAEIVKSAFGQAGLSRRVTLWLWPIIAGHHGCVPPAVNLERRTDPVHGAGPWPVAQQAFVARVAAELGIDLATLADLRTPDRSVQLALSGMVVMADWIASDDKHFDGIPDAGRVSMAQARQRARASWTSLGLRGGWATDRLARPDEPDLVGRRFGQSPRPSQHDAIALAERVDLPALVVIEAPMGEGKTEAALSVAEVLARRAGADGVFIGMPTQATSDAMLSRVRPWLASIDAQVPIALLHGRSRVNAEWEGLREAARFRGVAVDEDRYGLADEEFDPARCCDESGAAAAEWFLGRKRGLLAPVAVGTVDQVLYAATRTRHVMLRHAGLAGRVVILDEIHAYDVYMSQFLCEALRWLAGAGVCVVLLSATLPPAQRTTLARAYLQGALGRRDLEVPAPGECGYPQVTTYFPAGQGPGTAAVTSAGWRPSIRVAVETLRESADFEPAVLADAAEVEVGEGGCALIVCNTVSRAQDVYRLVRTRFGDDAVLLHSRLTARVRAERTERLLRSLGAAGDRPGRLVVVATQVAEQSFDVDADVLISDLAPIDLLLQRAGRLHRHERPAEARPSRVRTPRLLVSGVLLDGPAPLFAPGSLAVYGAHGLLRSAALVNAALDTGWSVPAQVPELVTAGYGSGRLGPATWAQAMTEAEVEESVRQEGRATRARELLLAGADAIGERTLAGLHDRRTEADGDDVAVLVRDGDESVEVVLVRRDPRPGYRTLSGRNLGPQGEAISEKSMLEEVLGSTLRLPPRPPDLTASARNLSPLSGWAQDPWLRNARALVLEPDLSVVLGTHVLTYDVDLGLVVHRPRRRS